MDPVTVFGAAAGALQIFDFSIKALLGSVRFLQALRESPKQIAELLQDADKSIARLFNLNQRLQQDGDPLVQKLPTGRAQELRVVASDGYEAIRHLHETLQRLHTSRSDSWRKKTWTAMKISSHASKDIERTLARIQRAHGELQRALQLVGLDMDADQSEQLSRLLTSVEDTRLGIESANGNIQSLITTAQGHETAISSSLNQLRLENEVATTRLLEGQSETNTSVVQQSITIANRLDSLGENERETQARIAGLQGDMSSKHDRVLDEIHSIRDEILHVMLQGSGRISTQSEATAQRLTMHQTRELNNEIYQALVTRPQAHREACDKWLPHSQGFPTSSSRLETPNACGCGRRKSKRWSRYKGIFGLQYESREIHEPDCPLSAAEGGWWRCSLRIQILPFLHKTIQLTCGVNSGFEWESLLRIWHTVKRSESPIFRLFDDFPTLFNDQESGSVYIEYRNMRQPRLALTPDWSVQSIDANLSLLTKGIMSLASQERISPWRVTDEFGNTLLHEALNVLKIFFNASTHLENLGPLLELAAKGGVHPNCDAAHGFRKFNCSLFHEADISRRTNVLDYAAGILFAAPHRAAREPLTQTLLGLGLEEATGAFSMTDETLWYAGPSAFRMDKLLLIQANKFLAEFLRDDVKEATAHRDLSWVRKQLQLEAHTGWGCCSRDSFIMRPIVGDRYPFDIGHHRHRELCPLELSLGWRDGLLLLLQAGANPWHATELASLKHDASSFRLLSSYQNSLPYPIPRSYILTVITVSQTSNEEIRDQMIDTILRLTSCSPPLATLIYDALTYPRFQELDLTLALSFLDRLYASGLKGIDDECNQMEELLSPDSSHRHKHTPLHNLALRMISTADPLTVSYDFFYSSWFLQRGANPILYDKFGPRNVVAEGLTKCFAFMHYDPTHFDFSPEDWKRTMGLVTKDWKKTMGLVTKRCEITVGDGCSCSCSTRGCLPLHQLVRCISRTTNRPFHIKPCRCYEIKQLSLCGLLEDWLDLCNANEEQKAICYQEAVRGEVFDRLQMTHTCCVVDYVSSSITRTSEDVCNEIRTEENELALQLDLITEAFIQFSRKKCRPDEEPLLGWWLLLDSILPEPKPSQRCYLSAAGPRHVMLTENRRSDLEDSSFSEDVESRSEASDLESPIDWSDTSDESLEMRSGVEDPREGNERGLDPIVDTEEAIDRDGVDEMDSDAWEDATSSEDNDDDCPESASVAGVDEYLGLDFFDVILRHFSKVLGKGWADDFLRRQGLAV